MRRRFPVALAEAILRLNRVVHAPYYALFLVGPAANVLEIWWDSRRHGRGPMPQSWKSVQRTIGNTDYSDNRRNPRSTSRVPDQRVPFEV